MPYSSLESFIERSKEGYYAALRQTQRTIRTDAPDWQPWLTYFLRAMQQQVKHLEIKIDREKISLSALPDLAVRILDHATAHGRVTMGQMILLTDASRNTLKEHFRALVSRNLLVQHGGGRSVWYGLP